MPDNLKEKPGRRFVRWIQVITLGCSLGLLTVYIALNVRRHLIQSREDLALQETARSDRDARFVLSAKPTGDQLSGLIEAQLAAFRKDDYPRAYELAAEDLKTQVPLPAFERMVRAHYPAIAKSASASFGVMVDNGEQAIVNVDIKGAEGTAGHYQYILRREGKGWKISGVTEVKSGGTVI